MTCLWTFFEDGYKYRLVRYKNRKEFPLEWQYYDYTSKRKWKPCYPDRLWLEDKFYRYLSEKKL